MQAIRTANVVWSDRKVCVALPFRRKNKDLAAAAHAALKLSDHHYRTHQLPDEVTVGERVIRRPSTW